MKKIKIFAFVVFGFLAINVQGQISVGANVGLQLPMGDLGKGLNAGFGFNAIGKYMLNDNMAVGLNLGYIKFKTEDGGATLSMIPITGLFEYYFGTENLKPYVGADIGLYNYGVKYEGANNSKMHLGFAPTAGVLYGLNDNVSLNANLKYHDVLLKDGSATWLGINVGVILTIN